MTDRAIIKTIRVQPDLNVLVEDSHNILIEITTPDGSTIRARSSALTNVAAVVEALDWARTWVRIQRDADDDERAYADH